nr:MAG TPA: hypothetical protein [Caudoviricetes sp.]
MGLGLVHLMYFYINHLCTQTAISHSLGLRAVSVNRRKQLSPLIQTLYDDASFWDRS